MDQRVFSYLTEQDDYSIKELLGEGAFAEVYRATNRWDSEVALKVSGEPLLADLSRHSRPWLQVRNA